MIGSLPEALTVGGVEYPIRSDYRNILQVFEAFQDPDVLQEDKWVVAIYLMFKDFSCADDVFFAVQSGFDAKEAIKRIEWFISAGAPEKKVLEKQTYSWTQDEQMIFSAVNKVAGRETRELPYLHWWTFLGCFNEVGEGTFSYVVGIRHKLNRGKKLEKDEREFVSRNPELIALRKPKTQEELEEEAERRAILEEVLG